MHRVKLQARHMPFDREQTPKKLAALAAKGVFVGTSSWKYEGWLGQLYTPSRYEYRGKVAAKRFERDCLAEYAEVFKTVCVDAAYYKFPSSEYLQGLAHQVPDGFRFGFKVTDEITIKRYPNHPRHGTRAGQKNADFLNADRFATAFLKPCEEIRSKVGVLMFEFSRFYPSDYEHGRDFMADLDAFLAKLPKGWPYAIEMRNKAWLAPEYFACLARHGVTHVFNSWEAESGGKLVLLLCPHLPDALAADLRAAGINHADLNGRLFIKTPSFLLDREPKSNAYRNPGKELNPFTLKSSRVVRVLLSHREQEWTQADVETHTGISRALVSLTLADLIEQELVIQTRVGNRHESALYRVNDFGRLLDAWKEADDWRKRVSIQQFSLLAGDVVAVAETARDALGEKNVFFTQWFAAHLRHPHTTPPLVSAYLKKNPKGEITWGRKVDNGGNLWLITPKDEGVFQETQQVGGFNLVSDIQIYLDLLQVGQRGPEQAQALREWEGFAK